MNCRRLIRDSVLKSGTKFRDIPQWDAPIVIMDRDDIALKRKKKGIVENGNPEESSNVILF